MSPFGRSCWTMQLTWRNEITDRPAAADLNCSHSEVLYWASHSPSKDFSLWSRMMWQDDMWIWKLATEFCIRVTRNVIFCHVVAKNSDYKTEADKDKAIPHYTILNKEIQIHNRVEWVLPFWIRFTRFVEFVLVVLAWSCWLLDFAEEKTCKL